jgi:hypothetical protein
MKVTVPVGRTTPPVEATVAVKVTACPSVEGLRFELTVVLVDVRFTIKIKFGPVLVTVPPEVVTLTGPVAPAPTTAVI